MPVSINLAFFQSRNQQQLFLMSILPQSTQKFVNDFAIGETSCVQTLVLREKKSSHPPSRVHFIILLFGKNSAKKGNIVDDVEVSTERRMKDMDE